MLRTLPLLLFPILTALPAQQSGQPAESRPPANEPVVSLQFRGGTLAQFIGELRAAVPAVNVLLPKGADQVQLPPVEVRDASIHATLQAVCDVAETKEVNLGVRPFSGPVGLPVYAITVQIRERRQDAGPSQSVAGLDRPDLDVLSLANLDQQPEEVLGAIETGLEALAGKGGQAPKLRYHAATKLLFVEGSPQALAIAQQVVHRLRESGAQRQRARRDAAETGAEPPPEKKDR
jgi:hypothetical protein